MDCVKCACVNNSNNSPLSCVCHSLFGVPEEKRGGMVQEGQLGRGVALSKEGKGGV